MADVYKTIENLLQSRGISGGKMSSDLGMSRSFMTELRKGRAKSIKAETAQKIADYFDVSVEYLMTGEQKEKPAAQGSKPDITFNDFTYAMYNESKELTEENKKKLLEMAKFFKQQQDKEKGT